MSKKATHKKTTQEKRDEKARRASAARRAKLMRRLPWYAVGVVAVAITAFLFISVAGGGGDGSSAADYPLGYTPPTLGEADAPIEMVMWGDFQCPFCNRFVQSTFPELKERFLDTGKLRFVWRNFENIGQPESHDAMVAAYCAGEQDSFWDYHDTLYENQRGENQGTYSKSNLQTFADELDLDRDAFDACIDDSSDYDLVAVADKREGRSEGVNGTPTFFINGLRIVGAQPTDSFIEIIEDSLPTTAQ